jgi:FkbM family methyltransferase
MSYSIKPSSRLDWARRFVRRVSPKRMYGVAAGLLDASWGTIRVGYKQYSALRALYPDRCRPNSEAVQLNLSQLRHPIWVRPGTTDAGGVVHSVVREAYGSFLPRGQVRTIVDAGANIGDTSVWYLNRFPEATVIALEPDIDNYSLLVKNCEPYGPRALALNAALWPTRSQLTFHRSGMASSHSVGALQGPSAVGAIEGLPIPALLDSINKRGKASIDAIDVLKCDIEGAELNVFSEGCDEWLPKVRCIVIEIHSGAHEAVMSATRRHGFQHRIFRELHVFWQ